MAKTLLLTCDEQIPSQLLTNPVTAARVDGLDIYSLETVRRLEVYAPSLELNLK